MFLWCSYFFFFKQKTAYDVRISDWSSDVCASDLLLLDLKDLRSLLTFVAENAKALTTTYGNVTAASVGAIQRRLLSLEQQGAEAFFGEPALALADFLRCDGDGRGVGNVMAADKLIDRKSTRLNYSQ